MNRIGMVFIGGIVFCGVSGWAAGTAHSAVIAQDNFNRADSYTIGTMSDGIHSWYESDPTGSESVTRIVGNTFYMYYSSSTKSDPGVAVNGVEIADGNIQVTIPRNPTIATNRSVSAGIAYRGSTLSDAATLNSADTYHVVILTNWDGGSANSSDLYLKYGTTILAQADLGTAYTSPITLEISFVGNHHIIKINGTETIDYIDPTSGRDAKGYVGLNGWFVANQYFDDFTLSSVPEPSTVSGAAILLSSLIMRRRR